MKSLVITTTTLQAGIAAVRFCGAFLIVLARAVRSARVAERVQRLIGLNGYAGDIRGLEVAK